MGISLIHNILRSIGTGIFFACLLLCSPQIFAQVNDSIPSDTVPAVNQGVKGKGGFENDSIYTNVKPREDAVIAPADKTKPPKEEKKPKEEKIKDTLVAHNPKIAAGMSAVLPGLGQIYNKKYWKLPIVYAGLGVCTYFIWTETAMYRKYKETFRARNEIAGAIDYFPNETDNTIKEMKEYHHRNVEISYIATGLIYLLNIVDATVDAHLYDFDVSDDLTMRLEPSVQRPIAVGNSFSGTGLTLSLRF